MPEPTLESLIDKASDVLLEILMKIAKAIILRNQQKLRTSDGANVVEGYGTLTSSNPSDSTMDGWSDAQCDSFATACKERCEGLQEPE